MTAALASIAILAAVSVGESKPGTCFTFPSWVASTIAATNFVGFKETMAGDPLRRIHASSLLATLDAAYERELFTNPHLYLGAYWPGTKESCKVWPCFDTTNRTSVTGLDGICITNKLIADAYAAAFTVSSRLETDRIAWSSSYLEALADGVKTGDWKSSAVEAATPLLTACPTFYDATDDGGTYGWDGAFVGLMADFANIDPNADMVAWTNSCIVRDRDGLLKNTTFANVRAAVRSSSTNSEPQYASPDSSLRQSPMVYSVPTLAARDVSYQYVGQRGEFEHVSYRVTKMVTHNAENETTGVPTEIEDFEDETIVYTNAVGLIGESRGRLTATITKNIRFQQDWGPSDDAVEEMREFLAGAGAASCRIRFEYTTSPNESYSYYLINDEGSRVGPLYTHDGWFSPTAKGIVCASAALISSVDYSTYNTDRTNFTFGSNATTQDFVPCGGATDAGVVGAVNEIAEAYCKIFTNNSPAAVIQDLVFVRGSYKLYNESPADIRSWNDTEYAIMKAAANKCKDEVFSVSGWGNSTPNSVIDSLIASSGVSTAWESAKTDVSALHGESRVRLPHEVIYVEATPASGNSPVYYYVMTNGVAVRVNVLLDSDTHMYHVALSTIEYDPATNTIASSTLTPTVGFSGIAAANMRVKWNWKNLPMTYTADPSIGSGTVGGSNGGSTQPASEHESNKVVSGSNSNDPSGIVDGSNESQNLTE